MAVGEGGSVGEGWREGFWRGGSGAWEPHSRAPSTLGVVRRRVCGSTGPALLAVPHVGGVGLGCAGRAPSLSAAPALDAGVVGVGLDEFALHSAT